MRGLCFYLVVVGGALAAQLWWEQKKTIELVVRGVWEQMMLVAPRT